MSWILQTSSLPVPKQKSMRGGGGNSVEGPPWGFPPPLLPKKKKRERSGEELTHGYSGSSIDCCLLMDFDAFRSRSQFCFHLVPSVSGPHYERYSGTKEPKKNWIVRDVMSWKIITSDAACPHSRTCTRNLGVAPLMLWTPLIQRRLPDHRVFLTLDFVPSAHALASSPIWLHHDALLLHLRG